MNETNSSTAVTTSTQARITAEGTGAPVNPETPQPVEYTYELPVEEKSKALAAMTRAQATKYMDLSLYNSIDRQALDSGAYPSKLNTPISSSPVRAMLVNKINARNHQMQTMVLNALGQTVINPDHVNYYTKGEV